MPPCLLLRQTRDICALPSFSSALKAPPPPTKSTNATYVRFLVSPSFWKALPVEATARTTTTAILLENMSALSAAMLAAHRMHAVVGARGN